MNILIIRVSAIGDVIHTLPALFLLKQCLPEARIEWVVQQKAASLLIDQPFIDHLHILPNRFFTPCNLPVTIDTIHALRQTTWDAIIDFQGLLKTSLLLAPLQGTKYGFDRNHAREQLSCWFTHHHTTPDYTNIIQKNLALAADVVYDKNGWRTILPTVQTLQKQFFLYFSPTVRQTVDPWFAQHNIERFIALCPNTTWPSKHWPTERWVELIDYLLATDATAQTPIVLVGSTFGKAAADLAAIATQTKRHIVYLPAWDLLTVAYALTKAAVVIAPDTGLLHLADYLAVPSIGLFGPTNKDRHGPFLQTINQALALQANCPHHQQKIHGSTDCMASLPASTVGANALKLFK
jgi:lipopolysaccharide heptosyltransferase I